MRLLFCALIPKCSNTFFEKASIIPYKNYKLRQRQNTKSCGFSIIFLQNILKIALFSKGN